MEKDFCYDCQVIVSEILNDDNSIKILNLISNTINRFDLIEFNGDNPSILKIFFMMAIYIIPIIGQIYYVWSIVQFTSLNFYFDNINKYFQQLKKKYKDNLKIIKEKYKSELENFKEISINEINKLKDKKFQKNFLNLINSLNNENYLQ